MATLVKQRDKALTGTVTVSVGLEEDVPISSDVKLQLVIIHETWFYIFSCVILLAIILFICLAHRTNIIRELGPEPATKGGEPLKKAFSIGRTQMALWFFLIVASYVYLYFITGELSTITGSVLGLMGISAGTALGAALIDKNKIDNENALTEQETTLKARIDDLKNMKKGIQGANMSADELVDKLISLDAKRTDAEIKLINIQQKKERIPDPGQGRSTCGFIYDLLTDDRRINNGETYGTPINFSFHRFQICIWTIALGIIFIFEVYENLRMPEFSDTLLGLMGISSGTYVGFKFPEH